MAIINDKGLIDDGSKDLVIQGQLTVLGGAVGLVGTSLAALAGSDAVVSAAPGSLVSVLRLSGTLTTNVRVTLPAVTMVWLLDCGSLTLGAFTLTIASGSGTTTLVAATITNLVMVLTGNDTIVKNT